MVESSLQSKTTLPALPRPRHQLLLLLTKVLAAQSQGEEVVLVELVEDLLQHLGRELLQKTLTVLGLSRVASFFGRLLPGPEAGGRSSLSLRHLLSLRDAFTGLFLGSSPLSRRNNASNAFPPSLKPSRASPKF